MDRVIFVLATLVLIFSGMTYMAAFHGFEMANMPASVMSAVTNPVRNIFSNNDVKEISGANISSESARQAIWEKANELANASMAEVLADGATQNLTNDSTEELDDSEGEDSDEDKDKIDVSNWRIFYTKSNFGGIMAYSLRYPPDWVMNDRSEQVKILTHKVDGDIYSMSFRYEPLSYNQPPSPKEEIVTISDTDYIRKSWLTNGTTTLVAYELQRAYPRPFQSVFATVPARYSSDYVDIYERILSTLAAEPADYPYTISQLKVGIKGPILSTANAIAEPIHLSWRIQEIKKINRDRAVLKMWLEDEDGNIVHKIKMSKKYFALKDEFTLPRFCSDSLSGDDCLQDSLIQSNKKYRVVALGFVCERPLHQNGTCEEYDKAETNKAYSDWFTVPDVVQFKNAEISITKKRDSSGLIYEIESSVEGKASPDDVYIVYFGNDEYVVLREDEPGKFKGEWTRRTLNTDKVYLMRTKKDVLKHEFYNAKTLDDFKQYADIIFVK